MMWSNLLHFGNPDIPTIGYYYASVHSKLLRFKSHDIVILMGKILTGRNQMLVFLFNMELEQLVNMTLQKILAYEMMVATQA